jgi:anti-sigma regulatory factor (Ser/Thr protein kinase)
VVQDTIVRVEDPSEVGAARRRAAAIAEKLGYSEATSARVALVVTELATNLVRHAGGGAVVLRGFGGEDGSLEILALDRGPGIADVSEALRDGFSTAGSPGSGLGAVGRLADQWDLFTIAGGGTIVMARFRRDPRPVPLSPVVFGGICLPHPGEEVCGDAWAATVGSEGLTIVVADGLGHGSAAAEASSEAVRIFRERGEASPGELLADAHAALRHTRGAAMGVARLSPERATVIFSGVGNISGSIITAGAARSVVSLAGIVGHQCRKIQEFTYPWSRESMLVLHSDGLQTRWHLDRYPGLAAHHPTLVAGALYRDHARGRDDVTVVVAREAAPA